MANGTGTTEQLMAFVSGTGVGSIPSEVLDQARLVLYDTIICMVAADRAPAAHMCDEALEALGGNEEAAVVPTGWRTAFPIAAFANANRAKLLDFDDNLLYHSHPANTVVSAAMAAGEARNRSVGDLLHAIAIGYDVAARVSLSMPLLEFDADGTIRFPNPNTHSYNTLGGVIAAALLLEMPAAAVGHAFAIAAVSAPLPAISRSTTADHWPTFKYGSYGFQAWTACTAALLAERGMTGDPAILDGPDAFWRMCGANSFDASELTHGLGSRWWIMETSFKLEPAGTWMRSAVRAARLATAGEDMRPQSIDRIELSTRALSAGVFQNKDQASYMDTQASYPYLVAVAACGVPMEKWSDPQVFEDPEIRRVVQAVSLHPNPDADRVLQLDLAQRPHRARGVLAGVTIILKDGRRLSASSKYGDGDPFDASTRATFEKVDAKFDAFAAPRLGSSSRRELRGVLADDGRSARDLVRAACSSDV